MMEQPLIEIHIKKFGPIENQTIRIAPMMIFTGNSNMGKSYVNYLVYFAISSLTENVFRDFLDSKFKGDTKKAVITVDAIQKWMNSRVKNFMIAFLHADDDLQCDVNYKLSIPGINEFHIEYEELDIPEITDTPQVVSTLLRVVINGQEETISTPRHSAIAKEMFFAHVGNQLITKLFGQHIYKTLLLPPGRCPFMGENYSMKNDIGSSVGMYRYFLKDLDFSMLQIWGKRTTKYSKAIANIIGGKLTVQKDNTQYLVMNNGDKIRLSSAASSVKELAPFLYSLQNIPIDMLRSYCLEEPEAHLHPTMQIAVTDLIANCLNDKMMFNITTHSDYILQRINQLIKLDFIRQHNRKLFKEICKQNGLTENHCINKDNVLVYHFDTDEQKHVQIVEQEITEDGFQMQTFSSAVNETNTVEDALNCAIDQVKEEIGK